MAKKRSKASVLSSQEIIERFVTRARRVEAHSLVKSGDIEHYAEPKMTLSISEAGEVKIQHHVCTDEEAIESLATRLRPFIVKSEPIYLSKVLDAISSSVPVESFAEDETKAFDSVRNWFRHRYEKEDSKRYGVQLIDEGGVSRTGLLSDALLAASWIYTDTVHADPRGDKAEAQELGYSERYRAGSSFFCEFALIVVSLLNIVRALTGRGLLQVSETIWNRPVTYEETEKANREQVVAGSAYVFPVGIEIPSGAVPEDTPGAMKLTPVVMRRLQHPEGVASVITFDRAKNQTGNHLAFCEVKDDSLVFSIDDVGELTVAKSALLEGEGPEGSVTFVPAESGASEIARFLTSAAPPNWLGLQFVYESQPYMMTMQLSGSFRQTVDDASS